MSSISIRPATESDQAWVDETLIREWAGPLVERGDEFVDVTKLPAQIAETDGGRVGLMTLLVHADHLEIFTLNSFREGQGIGSALMNAAEREAVKQNLTEIRLFVVNHNLRALGFYQRRGYRIWAAHRDSITRARLVKPAIPLVSSDGIPICDELELRKTL